VLLSLQGTFPPAILALADGTVFIGNSIGATGSTVGEVVFNTAMTGYQEILTDPSYCQQIVTLTYPHIGNYGVNPQDIEADKVHAAGLIIKDLPLLASNFRATRTPFAIPGGRTHGRHRQHRHPQADPPAAHPWRTEWLPSWAWPLARW
jgi:carbamoyl-phosphate synthase small subunit